MIGAGIVGLSTAYSLLGRGASVTVYERGLPGNGQSGGESRIFRHAHRDPRLVELACRSRAMWREWEVRLGVELVSRDGVVALGPAALAVDDALAEAAIAGELRSELRPDARLGHPDEVTTLRR